MKTIITILLVVFGLSPLIAQTGIDAAIDYGNGKIYFFTGDKYFRYDKKARKLDVGYPRSIGANWAGIWSSDLDAACAFMTSIYFFKGDECIRYDKATKTKSPGYPKKISEEFRGVVGPVDAVFQKGEIIYFFKGNKFYKYAQSSEKASGMQNIKDVAGQMPFNNVDAAIRRPGTGVYFFSNADYARFDESDLELDPGYPKSIRKHWGLPLTESSVVQNLTGKVIDSDGNPVEGMTVIIQNVGGPSAGRTSTATDKNGRWRYESQANSTIVTVREDCGAKPVPTDDLKSKKSGLSYLLNKNDGSVNDLNFQMNCNSAGIASSDGFMFLKAKPKVIYLIHGITPSPEKGKNHVGKTRHPFGYWGFDMVNRMVGNQQFDKVKSNGEAPVSETLNIYKNGKSTGKSISESTWKRIGWDKVSDADLGSLTGKHYALFSGTLTQSVPDVSLIPLYRNGAARLDEQVRVTIDDIYDNYQSCFGDLPKAQQPQIILVSHSFGGIVSRFMLSDPEKGLNGKDVFEDSHRKKADFIRDRSLYLVTLATPHNNSPLPGMAMKLDRKFDELADIFRIKDDLPLQYATAEVSSFLDEIADIIDDNAIRNEYIGGNRPCMLDFKNMDPVKVNQGLLAPHKMQRTDGTLIPVYTLGGRSPGHNFFDTPRSLLNPFEISCRDIFKNESGEGKNAFLLMLTDNLIKLMSTSKHPWGEAKSDVADIVTHSRISTSQLNIAGLLAKDFLYRRNQTTAKFDYGDGENDNDGFVGFDSALGFYLGTDQRDYFDHKKTWNAGRKNYPGSWYRIYQGRYGEYFPWDWDNHSTIRQNEATGVWLFNKLVSNAGPFPGKGLFSVWHKNQSDIDNFRLSLKNIKVTIHTVEQIDDLDTPGEADFYANVQIGHKFFQPTSTIEDKDKISPGWEFDWQGTGDLIPIRIIVTEKDTHDFPPSDNDRANINPSRGKDDLYLVYDINSGTIFSDKGVVGQKSHTMSFIGHKDDNNRTKVTLSINHNK
ncbi:MAG: hemopexin repeat-containing protein [Bacteroidota bacterium]